jgi:TatD DNase family protein
VVERQRRHRQLPVAPVPYRGKPNQPALVKYVAEEIARLRGVTSEQIGVETSRNFFKLFNVKEADSHVAH